MIFGELNLRKFDINSLYICPPHLYTVATLPWEIQKVIFQQYYPYILQIIYVISEENKLLPLYQPQLKNVTQLPCKMHNIFIWLKVCAFLQTLVTLEWAGCGLALVALKKNRLWCAANGMSGMQHYSKCSKWPHSARIHASSLFCQWSTV